jgi:hypothetical protein
MRYGTELSGRGASLVLLAILSACAPAASTSGPLSEAMIAKVLDDCGLADSYSVSAGGPAGKPVIEMGILVLDRTSEAAAAEGASCVVGALSGQGYVHERDFGFSASMALSPEDEAKLEAGLSLR